jgi:hypothetical protein
MAKRTTQHESRIPSRMGTFGPVKATRFPELHYQRQVDRWRIIDDTRPIGPAYPTEAALLADLERFASEYGANPSTTPAELKAQLAELDATISLGVANGMPDSYPVNYAVLLRSFDRLAEQVKQAEQRAETATVKELRARLAGLNGAMQASDDPAYTALLARAWLKTAADLRHERERETEAENGIISRRLANIAAY